MPGRTINNRPQVNKTTNVTYIAGNSVQRSRADPLVRAIGVKICRAGHKILATQSTPPTLRGARSGRWRGILTPMLVRAGPPGPALRPANSAPHVIPERPTEADRREAADQGSACQRSIVRQASDIGLTT